MKLRYSLALAALLWAPACRQVQAPAVRAPLEFKGEPAVAPKDTVRIGIRVAAPEATVSSSGPVVALEAQTRHTERWPAGKWRFTIEKGKLFVNGEVRPGAWRLTPSEPDGSISCGNYAYRGTVIVKPTADDKLTVINELDIDDYLKGVLPREAVTSWAEEALKAQAVASRTYLASHLARHMDQGFDLCSDVHCQVYGGATKEHPRTTTAVVETQGQILVYEGKPIGAFFHANCGGSTERIDVVWGTPDRPYLPCRRCTWGTAAPWYVWRRSLTDEEILTGLKAKGTVQGKKLQSISITDKGPSGRAAHIKVRTDAGTYTMLANDFRIALNPEKIRSTLFTELRRINNGYVFAGRGWGHGVGMCQWGAKGQAEQGKDYREILEHYYPGATLATWSRS